jgi:hypothetical protein
LGHLRPEAHAFWDSPLISWFAFELTVTKKS